MAVRAYAVTVGTTATHLTDDGSHAYAFTQSLAFYNAGAVTVYLGRSGVTTATGYPLAAGEHFAADLSETQDEVYGIVASGTAEVRVFGTGQTL